MTRECVAHKHDFVEIASVCSGEGRHETIHGETRTRPGDVYILRPGAWHAFRNCRHLTVFNCLFGAGLLRRELAWTLEDPAINWLLWSGPLSPECRGVMSLHLSPEKLTPCLKRLESLACLNRDTNPESRVEQIGQLALFLAALSRGAGKKHPRLARTEHRPHSAVTRAVQLMEEDLNRDWNLGDLAATLRIHPSYLARLCKAQLGLPPMAYFLNRRMEGASALLLRSKKSVSEVAYQSGWKDPNYFARCFRQHFGLAATEYRRRFAEK